MTTTVWIFAGLVFLVAGIILIYVFTGKNKEDKEVKNKVNRLNTLMQVILPSDETSCIPPGEGYTEGSEGELRRTSFIQALTDIEKAAMNLEEYLTANEYKITEETYNKAIEEVKKARDITLENLTNGYKSCSNWCTGYTTEPNTTTWFPDQYKCMCNRGYGQEANPNQDGYAYCTPYKEETTAVQGYIDQLAQMNLGKYINKPDVTQYTPFATGLIPDETITKFVPNTKILSNIKAKLVPGSFCSMIDNTTGPVLVHGMAKKIFKVPPKIYFINDRKVYRIAGAKWFSESSESGSEWIPGTIQGGKVTIEDTPGWLGANECYSNIFEDTSP